MGLNRELDGILVVSLEQAVAAPYCGLLLADSGARVIKVERREGDFARGYDTGAGGQSSFFAWLNRGKESICLDLNADDDRALLENLLLDADVLLSNLAPGALARKGLTGAALRKRNPGLVTCAISGYGGTGAGADKKAYDFLVQAESGLCSVTGTAEGPARVGISITDISTGLTAYSAILRALIQRGKTGVGIDLDIAMFDVMADWMNMPLMGHRYLGGAPARLGLTHASIAPYGAFAAGDGTQILLAIQNEREWVAFCDSVLALPGLARETRFADNASRVRNLAALTTIINAQFAGLSGDALSARLETARIATARLNSVAQLSEHSALRNLSVRFGEAEVQVADLPVKTDGARARNVPLLDQHGAAIRAEYSRATAEGAGRPQMPQPEATL
jgi:itaconate CoA-transferase